MENVGLMVALAGAMTKAPTAEQVSTAVDAWLDDHPEATTTVQDGAITNAKLASSFVTPGTAAAYSSSATYAVGDYVFYGGTLYRCTTAITTAETWNSAHWTAAVLGDDASDLKSALEKKTPISPVDTSFFEGVNYADPGNVTFVTGIYVDSNGIIKQDANTNSLIVVVPPSTTFYFAAPSRNRKNVCESANDFVVGETYTKLNVTEQTILYGGASIIKFTTGATAKRVFIYFYSGTYDYETNKNSIILSAEDFQTNFAPTIKAEYLDRLPLITPNKTSFFDLVNLFDPSKAKFYSNRYINTSGKVNYEQSGVNSLVIPVEASKTYSFFAPSMNRSLVAESADGFEVDSTYTMIYSSNSNVPITFTTGATATHIFIYFYSGTYNYEANKNDIVLNLGDYVGNLPPTVKEENLPAGLGNPLNNVNVLVFGDSITDCCNLTVNASKETTAYAWKNPSNSYVNGQGQTIQYSMWPKILKLNQPCREIRNYARSGASYTTRSRTEGEERQNLQYQIDVALNDLDNPHDVFAVDDFVPDIVIFALGTNDGAPNDSFDTAMAKTVYQSDGKSIDVAETLANLDDTKFCESARMAFMRIKEAFPAAQVFVVLPIQRADNDTNFGNLRTYLSDMAERYGALLIDGTARSGITRDFNKWEALGTYLKDGLHPNEVGQNLLARLIIASLMSNYIPFGTGFNA